MAALSKAGTPSLSTVVPAGLSKISGLNAGEALSAGDACYIKIADGLVYKSTGAAANAAADVIGYADVDTPIGEAVTLYFDVIFGYATGMAGGTKYYLSGTTAGGLDTTASTGGTKPAAIAIDSKRLLMLRAVN